MSNKNIYLIVIIAAVAILSGCSANQFEAYKEKIEQDPSYCNNFEGEEKDLCYLFAAESEGDPQICTQITSAEWQEECFEEVASEVVNPEECEELKTQYEKDSCYTNIAKLRKDVAFCEKTIDNKRGCQNVVARETNNENACLFPDCLTAVAIAKKNSQLCEKIPSLQLQEEERKSLDLADEKQNCYVIYAENLNDIEICDKLKDEGVRNGCFSTIARNTNDIKICKKIKVAVIPGQMPSFLDKTEEYKILNCYTAIAKENPNKCDDVKDDSMKLRNECYREMSRITNNPELCKNIIIPRVENVSCEDYFEYLNKEFNVAPTAPRPR